MERSSPVKSGVWAFGPTRPPSARKERTATPSASSGPSAASSSTTYSWSVKLTRGGCSESSRPGTTRIAFISPSRRTPLTTGQSRRPRWARSSLFRVSAVFITGTRAAPPEAMARPPRRSDGPLMESDFGAIPTPHLTFAMMGASRWPANLRTTPPTAFVRLSDLGCSPDLRRRCDSGEAQEGGDGQRSPCPRP